MKDDKTEPVSPESQEPQDGVPSSNGADSVLKQLEECRAQSEQYLDQWRRTMADFANFRKRTERDQSEAAKNRNAALITRLLPLLDDFDLAFENLPDELKNAAWIEGVQLIHRKMHTVFELEGVTPIESVGQEFDPVLHEAVTHEPSDEVPEGRVIGETRRGYKLNERVLRPAQVRVSSGVAGR